MNKDTSLTRQNFWVITLNSTAAFLLSYTLVFYCNHAMSILSAGLFNFDLSFDYNIIYYHIESYEWTPDSVRLIFSVGPIMVLILGIAAISVFSKISEDIVRIKILFIWIALIAFNYFFGGLLIGNLFRKGIGHLFSWLYFNDTQKLIVALVGLFCIIFIALKMARPVATSFNSYVNKLDENNFPFLITSQIILPFIIGTLLVTLYHYPRIQFQEKYSWISLAVVIAIIAGRINNFNAIFFDEEERKVKLAWLAILLTFIGIAGLRFLLSREYLVVW